MAQIRTIDINSNVKYNYAYMPIFFKNGFKQREKAYNDLIKKGIHCRKYWYPLITSHDIYSSDKKINLTNAERLSEAVLCLPLYPDLNKKVIDEIVEILSII